MLCNDSKPMLQGRINEIWNCANWGCEYALQPILMDIAFLQRVSRVRG